MSCYSHANREQWHQIVFLTESVQFHNTFLAKMLTSEVYLCAFELLVQENTAKHFWKCCPRVTQDFATWTCIGFGHKGIRLWGRHHNSKWLQSVINIVASIFSKNSTLQFFVLCCHVTAGCQSYIPVLIFVTNYANHC